MTEISLKIEGMSCQHCVAAVKKSLEGLEAVEEANRRTREAADEIGRLRLRYGRTLEALDQPVPGDLQYDEYGFVAMDDDSAGVYAAGCAAHPCDVSSATKEATGAALKAIQCMYGGE